MSSAKQAEWVARQSIDPDTMAVTATGTYVSVADGEEVIVVISSGLWVDGTHTFSLLEATSSGGAGAQTVPAANLIGAAPVIDGATDDDQVYLLGYKRNGSYSHIAVKNTVTGSPGTGLIAGAVVMVGKLRDQGQNWFSDNLPA